MLMMLVSMLLRLRVEGSMQQMPWAVGLPLLETRPPNREPGQQRVTSLVPMQLSAAVGVV